MHPSTRDILKHFTYEHLPERLQAISKPICDLAHEYAEKLDGPEVTAGLRKLLEAKDCMVRAAVDPQPKPRFKPPLKTQEDRREANAAARGYSVGCPSGRHKNGGCCNCTVWDA